VENLFALHRDALRRIHAQPHGLCACTHRPPRTFRADSPVFKDRRMILLEFSSVNCPRSVRDVRPIKSIGYTVRHCQSGTFDIDCTGRPIAIDNKIAWRRPAIAWFRAIGSLVHGLLLAGSGRPASRHDRTAV
jgi:hypothetical protein